MQGNSGPLPARAVPAGPMQHPTGHEVLSSVPAASAATKRLGEQWAALGAGGQAPWRAEAANDQARYDRQISSNPENQRALAETKAVAAEAKAAKIARSLPPPPPFERFSVTFFTARLGLGLGNASRPGELPLLHYLAALGAGKAKVPGNGYPWHPLRLDSNGDSSLDSCIFKGD